MAACIRRHVDAATPRAYKAGSIASPEDPAVPSARLLLMALLALPVTCGAADAPTPRFGTDGRLDRPTDYREWVYLSTGLDMSYSEGRPEPGHSVFDNVFVDPASWGTFKRTGRWPDGSMFVLEVRDASSAGSILKQGSYQTEEVVDLEVHVRDDARFPGGWGFFSFEGQGPAALLPKTERCYACHEAHGAVDTTFTQFYPTARAIASRAGTFRPESPPPPR